ncbi:hypothetical protein BDY21DRAFT_325395 [Lineolata rhizophorae]|uniref:Nephrocystin 3-like N-terminal domain-containing protein n=1 Tax=Lineolata rhizophorae TaxID=578093 RepID=A0A6A6NTK8_9PEZI|nr:hypothetical protein BDY21DRAFT_325395 [Lineolata rhizophorae]
MKLLQKLTKREASGRQGTREEPQSSASLGRPNPANDEEQRLGLLLLYAPPPNISGTEPYAIDIVAIHGLGGDLRNTWRHKNGTLWLQDLLPSAMPGARIYTYGYPSKIFLNRSVAGVRDFAIHLLNALRSESRSDANLSASRPIVYICHSLGGIVFKQAMNMAYERYPEIWMRSKGVVFFGTPHRSSAAAAPAKLFGDIFNAAWYASGGRLFRGGVKTDLLRTLSLNSSELIGIGDSFTQRANSFSIVTFYEQYVTKPLGSVVVDQSSAVLGVSHEKSSPLWADHRDICRFESEESDNYKHVLASLQEIAEESLKEVGGTASSTGTGLSLDEAEKACTAILNCVDVAGYESNLEQRANGTLRWILDNPEYNNWLSRNSTRLLWVTGFSGCGKTVLSSYVVVRLTQMMSSAIICRFFCNGRIDSQRDAVNLLRSIIYQIVIRRRSLLRIVRRASDSQGFQLFNRVDALWNLFMEISRHEKAGSIIVIIDAIDECEERTQISVTERIVHLLGLESEVSVRFFMTSRPSAPATYVLKQAPIQYISLNLDENQGAINEDIKLVVRQRLDSFVQRGRCDRETGNRLQQLLLEKADRTFLWVSIVLSLLEARRFLTPFDIQGLVQSLPSDLKTLYGQFLASIPLEDRVFAGRLLRIIIASARPLSENEIGIILTIDWTSSPITSSPVHTISPTLESIQVLLGPLVRVLDSKVHLIHQSLKDYLVQLGSEEDHPLAPDFGVNAQQDKLAIARACINYLARSEFHSSLFDGDHLAEDQSPTSQADEPEDQGSVDEVSLFAIHGDTIFKDQATVNVDRCSAVASRYPFFDYAATHWASHLSECEAVASQYLRQQVVKICDFRDNYAWNWFRYFWTLQELSEPIPSELDALVVCCFFGLAHTLQMLLDSANFDDSKLGPALYWASRNGHPSCVQEILRRGFHDGSKAFVNRSSALAAAAQYGSSECLEALVASGCFNLDEQGASGRTALSLAAGGGHDSLVRILLEHEIDVNLADHSGSPPLFWAVAANAPGIVSTLLADKRVNANQLDRKNRNALSWAAAEGYLDPLKRLLEDARIDAQNQDAQGRTPLILATGAGHLDNVRALLGSPRVDVSTRDASGRNAVSWAASQPNSRILHELLARAGPGAADARDADGWTPLAWAMNPPGYAGNAALLLLCRTPGVAVDGRDAAGRSPLSHAAAAGNVAVVAFLLGAANADVNSRDGQGCTPLARAARAGHLDVVRALAGAPGVDVGLADESGRTPLWYARRYQREDVVAFLEGRT